jgi:DNA (cytosine-5)-methyltransferase 1
MKAATLFSGLGAPEQAMPELQWLFCAEIEAFPSAVLKVRHPDTVNLGDVNAEDFVERARSRGRPDVLVFGTPCQDFSVAGRRLGLDGARGNMALVALGVARALGVKWLAFENVPGMFSSYSGSAEAEGAIREGEIGGRVDSDEDSDFAAFLAALQQCGYSACWRVLDAQYGGVPQRRRRIFVVAYLGDWRPAAAVLFEPEGLRGDNPPSREAGQRIAPTVEARVDGGCGGLADIPDVAWALQERDGKGADSSTKDGHLIAVAFSCKDHGADAGETSPTLRSMEFDESHANGGGQLAVATPMRVRRLTPRECERLQAFPDDYTLIRFRGKPAADGPRYRALGNAMCVNEIRWVLSRIELFEESVK